MDDPDKVKKKKKVIYRIIISRTGTFMEVSQWVLVLLEGCVLTSASSFPVLL